MESTTAENHRPRKKLRQSTSQPESQGMLDFSEAGSITERTALETKLAAIDNPKKVTLEQVERTLSSLRNRFQSDLGEKRHQGVEWSKVRTTLLSNPEALLKIHGMEAQGHEPDVYFSDDKGFDIGSCYAECPPKISNCVYDNTALGRIRREEQKYAEKLRLQFEKARRWGKPTSSKMFEPPKAKIINSSAVAMAKDLSVDIMNQEQFSLLKEHGEYNENSWIWLKTDDKTAESGYAYSSNAKESQKLGLADYCNSLGSWRGTFRVNWALS